VRRRLGSRRRRQPASVGVPARIVGQPRPAPAHDPGPAGAGDDASGAADGVTGAGDTHAGDAHPRDAHARDAGAGDTGAVPQPAVEGSGVVAVPDSRRRAADGAILGREPVGGGFARDRRAVA
jgi:hypothetical protein